MKNDEMKIKLLNNLNVVGSVVMLVGLFIGNFYTAANGAYAGGYSVKGYNVFIGIWYGFLLVLIPIVLLIAPKIEALSKSIKLINFVLPIVSLAIVFILKGQIADAISIYGSSSSSLGTGAYIYLIGNLVCLALGAANYFGYKTDAKSIQDAAREKNFNNLKRGDNNNEDV